MDQPVILSAVRTPIGKFQGGLAPLSATQLGAKVVAEAVRRAGIEPGAVDEAILGNVVQAGLGQNPARQAALGGGLSPRVAAMTINKVCGSGLKAVALAAQAVQLGESEIVVAGGMESMSNCPYLLPGARTGYRLGNAEVVDSMIRDGLWDSYEDFHMGMTGELVAEKYGISRQEQDAFAVESHQRAVRARKSCFFESQILPIEIPQKKGEPVVVRYDESPREDTSLEALARLKPAFKKDGTVTAGNAPGTNDGAAALIVTSERTRGATRKIAASAHRGAGRERRRAEMGDDGAGGRGREIIVENRLGPRSRRGPLRIERGVCRGGDCGDAGIEARSGESECEWRRRRVGASDWGIGRANSRDVALRA